MGDSFTTAVRFGKWPKKEVELPTEELVDRHVHEAEQLKHAHGECDLGCDPPKVDQPPDNVQVP